MDVLGHSVGGEGESTDCNSTDQGEKAVVVSRKQDTCRKAA